MIQIGLDGSKEESLVGKRIFHKVKGTVVVGMHSLDSPKIGEYLGRVVEVKGVNRIFYETVANEKKYIALASIGLVCETEDEMVFIESKRQLIRKKYSLLTKEFEDYVAHQINQLIDEQNEK